MKTLLLDMIALHIQAELPSLLGAPEHTLQHCWGNCMHCLPKCIHVGSTKSLIVTLFTWVLMWLHAKNSKGVRSCERAAQNRGEPRPIQRPGNVSLR